MEQALCNLRLLLVMDNFEDPLNRAGPSVRQWLQHLLDRCPQLTVLINSRQSVGGGLSGVTEKVLLPRCGWWWCLT